MHPLMKMLISLIAIFAMFLANILIMFARNKLKGFWKVTVTIFAYLLLVLSFIFIVMTLLSI